MNEPPTAHLLGRLAESADEPVLVRFVRAKQTGERIEVGVERVVVAVCFAIVKSVWFEV